MNRNLKIALIQQHVTQNKDDNLKRGIEAFEKAAEQGAKLIAFAELGLTYFYPQHPSKSKVENLKLAEPIPGPTTAVFADLARKWQAVVVLNIFEKSGDKTYDSSPVINADGSLLGVTRMVHIFEAEMQVAGFQNGYFTALCNRVGKEDCVTFEGKSFVTAPDGRIIAQSPAMKDHILICEIDLDEVNKSHARQHFIPDRRPGLYSAWNF